jgi:hypothetical protein
LVLDERSGQAGAPAGTSSVFGAQYPQTGQPSLNSDSAAVKPQEGQRTEAKIRPQDGQRPVVRSTSVPQFSQKKRALLFICFFDLAINLLFVIHQPAALDSPEDPEVEAPFPAAGHAEAAAAGQDAQAESGFLSSAFLSPFFFAALSLDAFLSVT